MKNSNELILSVPENKRLGFFAPDARTEGRIQWLRNGEVVLSANLITDLRGDTSTARITYTFKGEEITNEIPIILNGSGAQRYYCFICPMTHKPRRNLYYAGNRFVSREAYMYLKAKYLE